MSIPAEIAAAVVTLLGTGSFTPAITPQRTAVVDPSMADVAAIKAFVVPRGLSRTFATKVMRDEQHRVSIVVMKKVGQTNNLPNLSEVDALLDLAEDVCDYVEDPDQRVLSLSSGAKASLTGVEFEPLYIPDHLLKASTFTSVQTATYRIYR